MYSRDLSHDREYNGHVDHNQWSIISRTTHHRQRFHNTLSSTSYESLLEQHIPSADLMSEPDFAPHLSHNFDDSHSAQDDYDQAESFLASRDRFISSSGGDSRTVSLVEYGDGLYGDELYCDELYSDEFLDVSRRCSAATHNTRLLPDIPIRENRHGVPKSDITTHRKPSASSQRLRQAEPNLTRNKRSVTPTLLEALVFSIEDPRRSTTSPTPSLIYSSPSFSPSSARHSVAESMSSTLVNCSTVGMDEGRPTFNQCTLLADAVSKHESYPQNHAYLYINKPLPQPYKTSDNRPLRLSTQTSANLNPNTHIKDQAPLSELITVGDTYQKPRQAPPTPTTEPYKSHFDWSDDDGASNGLKKKLMNVATKSFTDLRQVGRQRSDSNRTLTVTGSKPKVAVLPKGTTKTVRQSARYSSGSNTSTIRASEILCSRSATPKCSTSRAYEDQIQSVAVSIKRTISCRTPVKLRKQPSTKSRMSRKSADCVSTTTASFAGLATRDRSPQSQRPKLPTKRWNMTVADNYTVNRPYKMSSSSALPSPALSSRAAAEATVGTILPKIKHASKRKTGRQSANGKRGMKISLSRLRNWLRRIKLRR